MIAEWWREYTNHARKHKSRTRPPGSVVGRPAAERHEGTFVAEYATDHPEERVLHELAGPIDQRLPDLR